MEFFDKLGKKASETYKVTAEKTSKIAKEAKLKMKMNENKSNIDDIYKEIGKKVYEKHVRQENINIKEDLEEECTKIDVLSAEIESIQKECMALKDKKQCENCHAEIEKNAVYCPKCGAKQEEIVEEEALEVEVLDNENCSEAKEEVAETVNEGETQGEEQTQPEEEASAEENKNEE